MNHCNRALIAVAATWFLLLGMVLGQDLSPAAMATYKTSPAIDAAGDKAISGFIEGNVKRLEDANPDVVGKAREALIEAARPGMSPLSAAYVLKYAEVTNKQITALLGRSKEIRTKLNAAIVVARVAEGTLSPRLEGAAKRLLDEAQEPLRLWGMKAGRVLLPELIKLGLHRGLMDKMLEVLQKHPTGSMTAEAYEALTAGVTDKKVASLVVAKLMDLVQARLKAYSSSTGVPEEPAAEVIPFMYLTKLGVWDTTLTAEQRTKAMQMMVNVLVLAAFRAEDPGYRAVQEELHALVNRCVQCVYVAARGLGQMELASVAEQVVKETQHATSLMGPVQRLVEAIRKEPAYQSVTIPKLPAPAK